jgi:cytoskeletal protein CcmA (bactofilin family)
VVRHIRCTHCRAEISVAPRALSVVCPQCNKRLVVENLRIRSYHAVREVATSGDIIVERRGHLVASVIKASNLTVRGKVDGDVLAGIRVEIRKTGDMRGDVCAPRLLVESGATLDGLLRIGES